MERLIRLGNWSVLSFVVLCGVTVRTRAADPWADAVVAFSPGATAVPGFADPNTTLGSPERFTGEGVFPSVVSIFSPAYGADELVSIGEGGSLTVRFDEPLTNDAAHLYGMDLIVFGNAGFIDFAFPAGQHGSPAILFGASPASLRVEVSADGVTFVPVPGRPDHLFPTQGWLDRGPYDDTPGSAPTNFLKPVNPALTLASFGGLTFEQTLALYDGSGGGTPIDIGPSGLAAVSFVRISLPDDGNPNTQLAAEIDAFAAVPEPATLMLFAAGGAAIRRRRMW